MGKLTHYEASVMEKNLKDNIINYAKSIWGEQYPQGHDWSVFLEEAIMGTDDVGAYQWRCVVFVLVYTTANSLRERVCLYTSKPVEHKLNALEHVKEKFEDKFRSSAV